jgi:vitamin B12 transporter
MLQSSPRTSAILIALVVAPGLARAQASRDTAPQLPSIVVTATRVPVAAVTAATTVLEGAVLRARGITHVLDALREVPGAFLVQGGSFGAQTSLFLRGSESSYTKVLVDGVAVNDPGGAYDFANLSTENVDRIEVVRGPTSVLYGSDAIAGVIQIFTRRGLGPAHLTASARGGNLATRALDAALAGATEGADYNVAVGQYQTSGIFPFNNHYRHSTLSGRFGATPDSLTDLHLTLQYSDDKAQVPTDGSGNPVDRNAFQYGQRFTFGLDLGRRFSPAVEGRLSLGSNTTDGGFTDDADNAADTLGFFGFQSLDHIQRRSADGRLNVTLAPGIVATAGGAVEEEQERSFTESQSQFGPSDGQFEGLRRNGAGYAQVVGARDAVTWNLSARLDDNQAFGTFGTYRAGLAYELPSATRIRGAIGTAFREPTFFQNYASGFVRGNPGLKPERTRSWELGAVQRAGDRLTLSGTLFWQRFEDLIDFTFAPPTPSSPNYFNIASANADGVEADVRLTVAAGILLGGSVTHLSTSVAAAGYDSSGTGLFRPGSRLVRRPDNTWTGYGDVTMSNRARIHAAVLRVEDREDIDFSAGKRVTLVPYTLFDVSADVDLLAIDGGRTVGFNVRVANALDESYQAALGYRAPGRTVIGGVRATF